MLGAFIQGVIGAFIPHLMGLYVYQWQWWVVALSVNAVIGYARYRLDKLKQESEQA